MNQRYWKRTLSLVACLCLAIILLTAAWPQKALATGWDSELYGVVTFTFHHYEHGIGFGNCPVYAAPNMSALRLANGKASCDTNSDMYVAGFDATGWLMVRYETNNGGCRVGYIPPTYARSFKPKPSMDLVAKFSYIPMQTTSVTRITDNPLISYSSFAQLAAGERVYVLGQYTYYGNWWYVECLVNGQLARGFIDRNEFTIVRPGEGPIITSGSTNKTDQNGYPPISPIGTSLQGLMTVRGDNRFVRRNAGTEYDRVAKVSSGEEYPVYCIKEGTNGSDWYYIYVPQKSTWGWIASGNVARYTPINN